MSTVHIVHDPIDDRRRGELIFGGALLIFSRPPGLEKFRDRIADLILERFDGIDPETAHAALEQEALDAIITELREAVRTDAGVREAALAALEGAGVDLADTWWDRVSLRMLPPGAAHDQRGTGWHRDTWGSNIAAQTNWWTPIFPITHERTISFAPELWQRQVANTSADWSPAAARQQLVPLIPEPAEAISDSAELPIVIEPGDLLCFSASQMHRSVPNRTGLARFSVEVRTVTGADLRQGRGAPDLDTATPEVHYRWFRHVADGRRLTAPGG